MKNLTIATAHRERQPESLAHCLGKSRLWRLTSGQISRKECHLSRQPVRSRQTLRKAAATSFVFVQYRETRHRAICLTDVSYLSGFFAEAHRRFLSRFFGDDHAAESSKVLDRFDKSQGRFLNYLQALIKHGRAIFEN